MSCIFAPCDWLSKRNIEDKTEVTGDHLNQYQQLTHRPLFSDRVRRVTLMTKPTDEALQSLLRFQNLEAIIFQDKISMKQTTIWDIQGMRRVAKNKNSKGLLVALQHGNLLEQRDLIHDPADPVFLYYGTFRKEQS
jgi:hypothetical protein